MCLCEAHRNSPAAALWAVSDRVSSSYLTCVARSTDVVTVAAGTLGVIERLVGEFHGLLERVFWTVAADTDADRKIDGMPGDHLP